MIKLVQHVPTFLDGCEPKVAQAESTDELLAIPWVASYGEDEPWAREVSEQEAKLLGIQSEEYTFWQNGKKQIGHKFLQRGVRKFHRWSLGDRSTLMVEHENGRQWWVVGFITEGLDKLILPRWDQGVYRCIIDGRTVDVAGKEVSSSCGDDVWLIDGRKVKRSERP